MERRLAAILVADVVGFSRLVGTDEEGTLATLKSLQDELIIPLVAEYRGRVVKLMGDGLLVKFHSAVDAVQCAADWQTQLSSREDEHVLTFRIGVHLGDVLIDAGDILGDGVNIAARLEGLSMPGGLAISDAVYQNVQTKLDIEFRDDGLHTLKNIETPVRVWNWAGSGHLPNRPDAVLALPEKPSVAVLPFDNMSGDSEQEYFSDGVTDDLITALSRLRWLFVIARNSSFHYKGASSDSRMAARELGVRYLIVGSVRKSGNRIRINAELVDGANGNQIWADRFDRQLADMFDLQDEIAATIAGRVDAELAQTQRLEAKDKSPNKLGAWDCYQRGMWHAHLFTREGTDTSMRFFKQAVSLKPDFAPAYSGLSLSHFSRAFLDFSQARDSELAAAKEAGLRSVEYDDRDPLSHWSLGRACLLHGELEQAIAEFDKAIALNPSYALGHYNLGWALQQYGEPERALEHLNQAIRLSPHDPFTYAFMIVKSQAYFQLNEFDQAWEWGERACRQPNAHFLITAIALAVAAAAGRTEAIDGLKEKLSRLKPNFSPDMYLQNHIYRDRELHQRYLDAFALAGFRE